MSFKESPLRPSTVAPLRLTQKDCLPRPIGTIKALAPALASKVHVLLPEISERLASSLRSVMTKTESCMSSAPLGRPSSKLPEAYHGHVRGIAVQALHVLAVPVDDLLISYVGGDIRVACFVSSDEWRGRVEPSVVRRVVRLLGVAIVVVLREKRTNNGSRLIRGW
jgi:hypothetical protein